MKNKLLDELFLVEVFLFSSSYWLFQGYFYVHDNCSIYLHSGRQSTKRAWSGRKHEKALSRLRSRLSRDGQSADSETFYKRISSFLLWEPEENITQLAVLLNPRPPPECYLAFLLLLVWAECDEGDTVELGHSTILPGLVIGGTGSPGDAPPYVMFPGLLQPFAKGRGKWGREGLEACWGISGLPRPSSTEFWAGVDESFIIPIKNLPSR